jgi:hypothetical protein
MRANRLVLKRFVMGQTQAGGPFLDLEGRAPGMLSFVLSVLGIDPTLSLRCFSDRVEVVEAGLQGRETVVIPLQKVSSIIGGHSRSLGSLVAAGVFGLLGVLAMFASVVGSGEMGGAVIGGVFWFVLAAIALVRFFLSRSMVLAVQNGGDKSFGLRFGQGVIEGVDVNPARVQQAVEMLNRATMDASHPPAASAVMPTSGSHALSA